MLLDEQGQVHIPAQPLVAMVKGEVGRQVQQVRFRAEYLYGLPPDRDGCGLGPEPLHRHPPHIVRGVDQMPMDFDGGTGTAGPVEPLLVVVQQVGARANLGNAWNVAHLGDDLPAVLSLFRPDHQVKVANGSQEACRIQGLGERRALEEQGRTA